MHSGGSDYSLDWTGLLDWTTGLTFQGAVTPICTIVTAASAVKMRSTVKTGFQRSVKGQSVLNS